MGISGRLNWSDPRLLIILLDSGKGNIVPHRVESNRFRVPGSELRVDGSSIYMKDVCPRPSASCSNGSPRGKTSQTPSDTPRCLAIERVLQRPNVTGSLTASLNILPLIAGLMCSVRPPP